MSTYHLGLYFYVSTKFFRFSFDPRMSLVFFCVQWPFWPEICICAIQTALPISGVILFDPRLWVIHLHLHFLHLLFTSKSPWWWSQYIHQFDESIIINITIVPVDVIITIVIVMAQSIVIKHINVAVICFGQNLLHVFVLIWNCIFQLLFSTLCCTLYSINTVLHYI